MAKKKLLSEAQVRRFMSLANIQPLVENVYEEELQEETLQQTALQEEEEEEDELPPIADDVPGEEMAGDDLPVEEPEEDLGDAEVSMDEELVGELAQAAATIQQVTDILTRGAGGEADLETGELEAEEEVLPPVEDEEDIEELEEVQLELSEEEIVNEVARRVAKRILKAKRAQKKMNEALGRKTTTNKRTAKRNLRRKK